MIGEHSVLPPSGAGAWKHCAMWPTMNALYPQDDTPESLEGHAAHWVAWELLAGHTPLEGQVDPAGTIITDEMLQGAELILEYVQPLIAAGCKIVVEKPVAISRISPKCWGTPDVRAFNYTTFELHLGDYKFGHRFVDEFENDQGVCYIEGVLAELAAELKIAPGELDQLVTVHFTIIQPRCFYKGAPVRTWTVRADALRGQINQLNAAAEACGDILSIEKTATTNSECIDCPGRTRCAALQLAGYSDAEFAVTSTPVELTPQVAGLELRMMERALERLQARVEGLRENVGQYIKQGHRVPFYHVEQGYGRDQWNVPNEQIFGMGELFGVDLSKRKPVTPKQAAKLGIDATVIKQYSATPLGEIKLVADNNSDARRVFGQPK